MNFKEYQKLSRETAIYPDKDNNFIYPTLGLAGESGEVVEKIKHIVRDDGGKITDEARKKIGKEIGDTLWYLSQLATELDLDLEEIASSNIEKLFSRKERGTLPGRGDNR